MEGSVHACSTYSFNSALTRASDRNHLRHPPLVPHQPPHLVLLPFSRLQIHRTSSDVPDIPSPPSPTPVLDVTLPTESQSSLLPPAAPCPSRPRLRLSSTPDVGAVARGGSANVALDEERDALDPPSTNRENITAAPDLPPQSLSHCRPFMVLSSCRANRKHPPHSSHGQYDIV
ncbi:hypothetical protein EDB83DRAFT_2378384 [Lactarius deliciosus]|nr:hypothetical protein EDB83DRAFT_2378384 [Lactarius deliciosus]